MIHTKTASPCWFGAGFPQIVPRVSRLNHPKNEKITDFCDQAVVLRERVEECEKCHVPSMCVN